MTNVVDDFVPPLPPPPAGARGYRPVTANQLWHQFHAQGATISPYLLSLQYLCVEESWVYTALRKYHDFQMAVFGEPPQEVYASGVYVCAEFAWDFKAFLHQCHLRHWRKALGKTKLAVGFTWTGNRPSGTIPAHHAIVLMAHEQKSGQLSLCGYEPQLESVMYATYGKVDCTYCVAAVF